MNLSVSSFILIVKHQCMAMKCLKMSSKTLATRKIEAVDGTCRDLKL